MKAAAVYSCQTDGFRGCLYRSDAPTDRCVLVLAGDEGDDFMSRSFARWLTRVRGCHALCLAVRQEPGDDTGVHGWVLDRIETAARRMLAEGMSRVGILGISMQAAMALSAAARIPELSLVLAFSPCDFVPWGFHQGKIGKDAHGEWPSGGSAFSWRGKELPFQPATLDREAYWQKYCQAKKEFGEMHAISVFDCSEERHPIEENCFIPVENIAGKLILIGCEDDSMWASGRYIRRMEGRLKEKGFSHPLTVCLYPRGTHLLLPDSLLRSALPLVGGLVSRMFVSGRQHPKECTQARLDVDKRLAAALQGW